MSETLCTLRTKGGGGQKYTETSLWTNQSPSSSFSLDTVTLSDAISNYKYLGIKYRMSTSVAEENIAIFNIDDVKQSVQGGSTNHNILLIGTETSANAMFGRMVFYVSDTSITLQQCYRLYSQTLDNTLCIPLEILGINELAQGKTNQTVLWTNSSPSSTFAAQTIALDLSGYDAIILKCSSLNSNTLPSTYPTHACAQQYITVPYGTAGDSTYRLSYGLVIEGSSSYEANRETVVTTSGVTFGGGYRNYSAGDKYAIPIQIIGVKIS